MDPPQFMLTQISIFNAEPNNVELKELELIWVSLIEISIPTMIPNGMIDPLCNISIKPTERLTRCCGNDNNQCLTPNHLAPPGVC